MPGARGIGRRWVVASALVAMADIALIGVPGTGNRAAWAQWPTWLNEPAKPVTFPEILVDAAWLRFLLTRRGQEVVVFLDARSDEHYRAGHIPGAFQAWSSPKGEVLLPERVIDAGTLFVVYTDDREPLSAARVFMTLEASEESRGRSVRVLNGGLNGWQRADGPVSTKPTSLEGVRKGRFQGLSHPPDTTVVITIPTLANRFGRPGLTIVDPRPVAEWEKGHIPHSLPVNFDEFRNDDGTLMDGPTMRPILATFGPRDRDYINLNDEFVIVGLPPETSIVHPYLALRVMGIPRVRMLPESFEAWRDRGLPVTRVFHAKEMREIVEKAHPKRVTDRPAPSMILLDLRHDPDFNYSHLPGAILLSPDRFEAKLDSVVNAHWPGADRTTIPFAVYCYGPDCIRSRNATTKAAQMGFRNLLWFRDGPQGYRSAGGTLFGQIAE